MPWWSWIVIWVALLALSLLYVVLLGIKLWRHVVRVGKEFDAASARLGSPSLQFSEELAEFSGERLQAATEPGGAVHADPEQLREVYRAGKRERRLDRVQRRVERRSSRGQAQSLRDLDLINPDSTL